MKLVTHVQRKETHVYTKSHNSGFNNYPEMPFFDLIKKQLRVGFHLWRFCFVMYYGKRKYCFELSIFPCLTMLHIPEVQTRRSIQLFPPQFLYYQLIPMMWVLNRIVQLRCSFEYPKHRVIGTNKDFRTCKTPLM